MKIGDMVVAPECEDPNETGLIVELCGDGNRFGVLWAECCGVVDFEHPRILEVISESR